MKKRSVVSVCFMLLPLLLSAVELTVDMDLYDHISEPQVYQKDIYGPDEIALFFNNCKSNGVTAVYWRAQCQVASYWSKLNYNLSEELTVRSYPEGLHHSGAFAAKVGVRSAEDGIFQIVECENQKEYQLSAWIAVSDNNGACLRVDDIESGNCIAKKNIYASTNDGSFAYIKLPFKASGSSVRIGVYGKNNKDINTFVVDDIVLSDEKGNNLLKNGDMEQVKNLIPIDWMATKAVNFFVLDGNLNDLSPERHKKEFGGKKVWLPLSAKLKRSRNSRIKALSKYDPLKVAVKEAHKNSVEIYAWFDPLDDGRLVPPMHSGWWVSRFHEDHPEYRLTDKNGHKRWGLLCFGYEAVREYKNAIIQELLDYGVDGIYLKTAFQHNRIWDGWPHKYDAFNYSDIALAEYEQRWGKPANGNYDLSRLKIIQGEFFLDWVDKASEIIHKRGKKLVLSIRPGERFENNIGDWPNNWQKMVDNRLIDCLLIEPRHNSKHAGLMKSFNERFGYTDRCRKSGVKIGFDFYLTALVAKRMRSKEMNDNPRATFVAELNDIAHDSVDFIGIYEALNVDMFNSWSWIKEVHNSIRSVSPQSLVTSNKKVKEKYNFAYIKNGATATISVNEINSDAELIIDGDESDSSSISVESIPFSVTINLTNAVRIGSVRIYPGFVGYSGNASGECGLRSYKLEGLVGEKWINLGVSVKNALTIKEKKSLNEYDYFYEHKLDAAEKIDAFRLVITKSSDTGYRRSTPNKVSIPEDKRSTYIREIKLFAPSSN